MSEQQDQRPARQPGIGPDTVPSRSLRARVRKFRGKVFVASGDHAFELEDAAAFLFGQIDGSTSIAEIGLRLAAEYDVSSEEALADTAELFCQLAEHGVVDLA